jgi:hypothetical protein
VATHAVAIFVGGGWLGQDWEERKIRQFMERDERAGRA